MFADQFKRYEWHSFTLLVSGVFILISDWLLLPMINLTHLRGLV